MLDTVAVYVQGSGTTIITLSTSGSNAGDFSVKALGKSSLAPGASTTFKAVFKPQAKGAKNAVIKIKSNDKDENPFAVPVTGAAAK